MLYSVDIASKQFSMDLILIGILFSTAGLVVIQLAKQSGGLVIWAIVHSCRSLRFILIDCDMI